jgi:hypothetical protein
MKLNRRSLPRRATWLGGLALLGAGLVLLRADQRHFTYTYEPETLPKGVAEFEQWITLRTQRNRAVGRDNYNRWQLREELEYGVTDNYSVAIYVNTSAESFRDPATGVGQSSFSFEGLSLENRLMILNPAERPVGLTLYLEPRFSGDEAEIEQKIILGQRHGKWKWALNLTHATEWEKNLRETEGELEVSLGVAHQLGKRWHLGVELRDHNKLPDYRRWENTALYVGPVLSYRAENWWLALSIMPQVYGANYGGDPDGNSSLELKGHERLNVRLLFGIRF